MLVGFRPVIPNRTGLGSRKAMLETLVRQLNMVRLSVGAAALLAMVGCVGTIGDGGQPTADQSAMQEYTEKAAPVLMTNCVACHNGSRADVGFLVGANDQEIHDGLIAYQPAVINLDAPASSRILTKGVHDGPALLASEASNLLEWIQAEKDAQTGGPGGMDPGIETEQFTPAICTSGTEGDATCPGNDVDLTAAGLPGAKLHFVAQALGSGLYLNRLSIIPGADGVYLEHPLFVSYPAAGGEPVFDTIDRFFNIKMNVMGATPTPIGGGTAAFIGFLATDKIAIHFKALKAYQPDAGGTGTGGGDNGGGCKALGSFKTNAQQLFSAPVAGAGQACRNCHAGTDANATSAMNITGVNATDDAMITLACNQIRTRINTTTPDQSGVYLAPDPANGNHPFKFTAAQLTTFKNGVNVWINAEKTAP